MSDPFSLGDKLGPEKIIHINNSAAALQAIVVIDNTACGTAVGGCRMAPDTTLDECARLARAMTLKNASAGLPHGGAKSVIIANPSMELKSKENLMRAFAQAIVDIKDYVVGPDMGTNEHFMACVYNEIQRAVGLPREIGGIPLDEIGATGWGVCAAIKAAEEYAGIKLHGSTFVVQGFGAVGYHAARFLENEGAIMIGACDSKSTVFNDNGIDVKSLYRHKKTLGELADFEGATTQCRDKIVDIACDIWIPAARPDILTMDNVNRLKTKLIAQGANIPISKDAEEYLDNIGIISIPDFIANAGGVISAAVEYRNGSETEAMRLITDKITVNTKAVLSRAKSEKITPRTAAESIAIERIRTAEKSCRFKA